MSVVQKYKQFVNKDVTVTCNDGSVIVGYWSEIFSAADNEYLAVENDRQPPGESILVESKEGIPIEIYVDDIYRIEEVVK